MATERIYRGPATVALAVLAMLALALAAACGGGGPGDGQGAAEPATVEPNQASAPAAVTPTATATPLTMSPTAGPSVDDGQDDMDGTDGPTSSSPDSQSQADLIAKGEKLFQETAGCHICHGRDAMGFIGSPIVGKRMEDIELQMEINPAMEGIYLLPQEIEALAAYLQSLGPPVPTPQGGQ